MFSRQSWVGVGHPSDSGVRLSSAQLADASGPNVDFQLKFSLQRMFSRSFHKVGCSVRAAEVSLVNVQSDTNSGTLFNRQGGFADSHSFGWLVRVANIGCSAWATHSVALFITNSKHISFYSAMGMEKLVRGGRKYVVTVRVGGEDFDSWLAGTMFQSGDEVGSRRCHACKMKWLPDRLHKWHHDGRSSRRTRELCQG